MGCLTVMALACSPEEPTVVAQEDMGTPADAMASRDQDLRPDLSPPEPDAAVGDPEWGATLYSAYCAFCHGTEGEGYTADAASQLANQSFLTTASDEFLETSIIRGRPGTSMSAWGIEEGGPLDEGEVADVVALIRSWQNDPPLEVGGDADGTALRGEAVYSVLCSECHGIEGEGRPFVSLNNPWFLHSASDGFLRHAIEQGRPGTPMPGFAEQLTRQNIEDLVSLIRSWQRPVDGSGEPEFEPDLEDIIINPDGVNPLFELTDERYVSVDAVNAAMEAGQKLIILDARPHGDYLISHISGATSLPFYLVEDYADQLPRDTWIITYCGCPHAISGQAWEKLASLGFRQIAVLNEGFYVWQERGYPVTVGEP